MRVPVLGGLLGALLFLVSCGAPGAEPATPSRDLSASRPASAGAGSPCTGRPVSESHIDYSAPDPRYKDLTSDQKLDRLASSPWFGGLLRGITGTGQTIIVGEDVVTDFPLTVSGVYGPNSGYHSGSTVTLRVLGGKTECAETENSLAPQLRANQDMFAVKRDQGVLAGGHQPPAVLVVSQYADVFEISNGLVSQPNFTPMPLAQFEKHFAVPS